VPGDMPKVSSPPVSTTTLPAEQVNGFHDNVVQSTPAPPPAHAEPNGFDEFDPRSSIQGIVLSFLAIITLFE
jgi:epsin